MRVPSGYRLIRTIGSGGEGSVFLMLHEATGQLRAVKKISRLPVTDPMFMREVRALRYLRHAGLPQLLEICSDAEYFWIVMTYVKGKSLQQIMDRRHRLDEEKTVDAGMQLAKILTYLHTRKARVLHLDLKPANIMVRPNGRLILLDFGSAFRSREDSHCLSSAERIGTDGFAPPELYDPKATVSERSDIYELGAVLYYLISGVLFSDTCIKSHIPGCPEELETVILRCLEKDPLERYASVKEVYEALEKMNGNRKRRRRREYGLLAVLLAVASALMAVRGMSGTFAGKGREEWNCERLLQEAVCADMEEKGKLYLKAAFSMPSNPRVYEQILDESAKDGRMERREWELLTCVLHAQSLGRDKINEDILRENKQAYGKFCIRTWLLCRYSLEKELRNAAGGWFEKAEASFDGTEAAAEQEELASLLLSLEKAEMRTTADADSCRNEWQIRNELLSDEMMEIAGETVTGVFAAESLDRLLLAAGELEKCGIGREEIRESARHYAGYDRETDGKIKQRLELIDRLLGVSDGKEQTAWEKVTE